MHDTDEMSSITHVGDDDFQVTSLHKIKKYINVSDWLIKVKRSKFIFMVYNNQLHCLDFFPIKEKGDNIELFFEICSLFSLLFHSLSVLW